MNFKPAVAILVVLAAAATYAAENVKQVLAANYAAMDKAVSKKDSKTVLAFLSPDCKFTMKGSQPMDRKAIEASLSSQFKMAKSLRSVSSIKSLKESGATATVVVTQSVVLVIANPNTKKDAKIEVESQTKDVWKKGANGWKIASIDQVSQKSKMDGKPIGPRN